MECVWSGVEGENRCSRFMFVEVCRDKRRSVNYDTAASRENNMQAMNGDCMDQTVTTWIRYISMYYGVCPVKSTRHIYMWKANTLRGDLTSFNRYSLIVSQ